MTRWPGPGSRWKERSLWIVWCAASVVACRSSVDSERASRLGGGRTGSEHGAGQSPVAEGGSHPGGALGLLVREIVRQCTVSASGLVEPDQCRVSGLIEALGQEERRRAAHAALRDYCTIVEGAPPTEAALAAARMGRLSGSWRGENDDAESLYACVRRAFLRAKQPQQAAHLARALASAGAASGRLEDALRIVRASPNQGARVSAYEALWPNGRLVALGPLRRLLDEGTLVERIAVVRSFAVGAPLSAAESAEVCRLLLGLLEAETRALGDAAAETLARACPERRGRLVELAERRLRREQLSATYVRALSIAAGFFEHKAEPKLLRAIEATLERLHADKTQERAARLAASLTLERLRASRR